ncbi:hypothetical protein QYE76_003546 [Lolium multiflorum]|uniref:Transposase (putative) gypsy type domain-containing protein n=1 Tax=Lolium multiflorum TaxID=4521 RepID=A0AAD8RSQ7_LOLMU|nr:hypothetical protein QYE76_003546 [Lolium multiflorum]
MAAPDLGASEWERSKISTQEINLLKKLGLNQKDTLRLPSEESYPTPPIGYRVSFVDHLIRGLAAPIHDFLRGLLFVYGLQLHHLTPNSILHISIFITLCESFLGVQPNWALWKRIFLLRRNGSHNIAYNIGGVVICVRPDVEYFNVKFPDSVQGWRKKWLYVHEECADSVEYNILPFDGSASILRRRSWDAEATEEEKIATEALMSRIHELQNTRGTELSGIQITAYFLRIRVQPLQARKNPLWINSNSYLLFLRYLKAGKSKNGPSLLTTIRRLSPKPISAPMILLSSWLRAKKLEKKTELESASVESLRNRLHDAENALSERTAQQLACEAAISARLESQNRRFVRKTSQEYGLEKPEDDRLLDALSLLEIYGDEVRQSISDAKAAFSRLFPYFFLKTDEPNTFAALAKRFISKEDLGLALRQENLKIGVEGTIALVAESQQHVDWAKVGDAKSMETKKWQSLIKAAKPSSKKILAFLGYKPTPSSSSAKPEVK